MKNKKTIIILALVSLLLVLDFLFIGLNKDNYDYLLSLRIPKLIAILITAIATAFATNVGSSIAFSSTLFQTITNNIILTPSILGLDSLYLLIQTTIVFYFGSASIFVINKNINFLTSILLMLVFSSLIYGYVLKKNKDNIMKVLLVGLVLSSLFSSISSFLQMVIDPNEFLIIQDKMFASFNNVNTKILALASLMVICSTSYVFINNKTLDVLNLGRDNAVNLGVDYKKTVKVLLFNVFCLVSISTALVGPITFLGLLVVNLARHLSPGYGHDRLLISSSLIAITALLLGQIIAERILNFAVPISIIINFLGGIYFIYLLVKENL